MKIAFVSARHHSARRTFGVWLLAVTLSNCWLVSTATGAGRTPPNDVQELLEKAHSAPIETRAPYLLDAAERALQQKLPQHAEPILGELDELALQGAQHTRASMLRAWLLLQQEKPQAALTLLQSPELQRDSSQIPAPGQLQLSLLRAQALAAMRQYFAAAHERIFVDALLNPDEREDNRAEIRRLLDKLSAGELQEQRARTSSPVVRGWLDLALGTQAPTSATNTAAAENPTFGAGVPQQIALLLPQSGRLASFGNAVRDGFFAAWHAARARGEAPPAVRIYDTESGGVVALYTQAVAEGASLVIGPLEKNQVAQLYTQPLPVPLLALNRASVEQTPPPNLYQFALAPEDETEQLAVFAARDHRANALVIVSEAEAQSSELEAFRASWKNSGGTIAATAVFRDHQELSAAIRTALNIPRSEARAKEMERIVNRNIQSAPHRRSDIDMVLMLAKPAQARLIKPLLDFYYAGDLPIYSTSRIYSGYPSREDRDAEKVRFIEIPWVLQDSALKQQIIASNPSNRNYLRLYALGIDSFALHPLLREMETRADLSLTGQTGKLSLNAERIVKRELPLAQMRGGTAQVLDGNGMLAMDSKTTDTDDHVETQTEPPAQP